VARRALTLSALAALVAAACSHERGSSGGIAPARVDRLLGAGANVEIRSRWQPATREPKEAGLAARFERRFEREADVDFTLLAPRGPAAATTAPATQPAPVAPTRDAAGAAAGQRGLRFPGAVGAAAWWLPMRPEASVVVSCAARRALAPTPRDGESPADAEERALVGRLVVIELAAPAPSTHPAQIPLLPLAELFHEQVSQHRSPPLTELATFARPRIELTTSPRTQSVVVLLFAGTAGWWNGSDAGGAEPIPGGAIEFDNLALFELPLARALIAESTGSNDATPPWSAWRRDLSIAGELRPALVAIAPTEIRVQLVLPDGAFRLRFSYGVAEERREDWGHEPIRFFARLESAAGSVELPLARPVLRARDEPDDAGWQECRYDGNGDGGPATLTLATVVESGHPCEDVALFGEPRLVRRDAGATARPNVVLVSVDTLRADRVGAIGGSRTGAATASPRLGVPTLTPRIDELARGSVLFSNARALAPYTLPSHATLLTGLHPAVHGVEGYGSCARAGLHPFLAQRLADAGWETAAFTAGGFLAAPHGLWHGFDRWSTLDPFAPAGDPVRLQRPRRGSAAFNDRMWQRSDGAAIRAWLADHRDEPFFLFIHTYLVHNYRPPADLAARFGTSAASGRFDPLGDSDERTPTEAELAELAPRYDATVVAADREIGTLVGALRDLGLLDRTIVAVTSDHGEELGEHGGFGHGRTLFDEVLRVPLIVRAPGVAPRVVSAAATLADVAPTLLRLADLEPLPGGCGRALLPELADEAGDDAPATFAELDEIHLGRQRALLAGDRKLIVVERMSPIRPPLAVGSLFDLGRDPAERMNLAPGGGGPLAEPDRASEFERLRALLDALLARFTAERTALGIDLNAASVTNPELDALGYGR